MRPVTAESMRSRQTGHVGNSYMDPGPDVCVEPMRAIACEAVSDASIMTDRTRTI
jgi:hypothetical protein